MPGLDSRFYPYTRGSLYSGFTEGIHEGGEQDLARSISGPNLVATMYIPGFGLRVFAELMTISYQLYGELAPVPVNGQRSVAGIARGPIWVAGSMVFVYFDRHAILDILDYADERANPNVYLSRLQTKLRQQEWVNLMSKIQMIEAKKKYLDKIATPGSNMTLADLQSGAEQIMADEPLSAETYEYFRQMYNVDVDLQGGLLETSRNISQEIVDLERTYTQALRESRDIKKRTPTEYDKLKQKITALHLPPFNVQLFGANESGVAVKAGIYGVVIQTDGATFSVEDLITEGVCQYQAISVDPLDNVNSVPAANQRLSLNYLQTQVESMELELWKRISLLRGLQNDDLSARKFVTGSYMNDLAVKFVGALSLTADAGNVYLRFPSQTQYNSPPINPQLIPESKLLGYYVVVSGGELQPKSVEAAEYEAEISPIMRGFNSGEENCAYCGFFVSADPATEVSGGTYGEQNDIAIPISILDKCIEASSPRINISRQYRVSVYFTAALPTRNANGILTNLQGTRSNLVSTVKRRLL